MAALFYVAGFSYKSGVNVTLALLSHIPFTLSNKHFSYRMRDAIRFNPYSEVVTLSCLNEKHCFILINRCGQVKNSVILKQAESHPAPGHNTPLSVQRNPVVFYHCLPLGAILVNKLVNLMLRARLLNIKAQCLEPFLK